MALRNQEKTPATETATTASAGKFEDQETTGAETASDTSANSAAPSPAPTSAPVPAPRPTGAVSVSLSASTVLKGLEWAIPASELEAMSFGVFPRITVGLDGFSRDKDEELGKKIKVSVLSWNPVWFVVTGEQNDPEANKLIRTSYDSVNLKGGEGTIADYVKFLKSEGYDKTSVKQYVEVYCNLMEYQEEDGKGSVSTKVVADDEQEILQVSLSPQSVGQWMRYMLETGMRRARGIEDNNIVVMTQNKKVLGSNKFGFATFSAK